MRLRRLIALGREALLLELALYRSLGRWLARRPDVPRGASPIGYAQLVGPTPISDVDLLRTLGF